MPVNEHCQQTHKTFKRKAFEGKEKFFSSFLLSPSLVLLLPFSRFSFYISFSEKIAFFFPLCTAGWQTLGDTISGKLIMFWQTAGEGELTGTVGLGDAETSKGNTKQYTFVLDTPRTTWVSMDVRQGGESKRTTLWRNWSECGLWVGPGQPFNHLSGRDPSLLTWCMVCVPPAFAQPHSPGGPGSLARLQGSQQFAGFSGTMTMVTFRNGARGGTRDF